jgi:hypothetical protein
VKGAALRQVKIVVDPPHLLDETTDGTNDRATPNTDKNKTNGAEDLKIKP